MQRDVSYGELAALQDLFYEQVEEQGIVFPDEEIEQECLFDFQQQYIDGFADRVTKGAPCSPLSPSGNWLSSYSRVTR